MKRSAVLQIRLYPSERDALQREADEAGVRLSEFARKLVTRGPRTQGDAVTYAESTQRLTIPNYFTDVLIAELQERGYVVLAKQEHQDLVYSAEERLERTDVPI
jgi:hypothetical protein